MVNVSATARVDIKLTVGAEAQTVTVEADALAVQADSNVVSTLISSEQISQIATENRNFAALAALGLGVSSALPDSNTPTSVASNFTISVNGLRQSHNIWLIDGGEADDRGGAGGMDIMPSQDAIAEFTVMSSNYPPDYGISSGATMSLSLKSGTQKFHGTLFEFNRNTDYDANNFFNKYNTTTPTPRQVLNYNIYGFNIGGPLLHSEGLQHRTSSKTFFFWNEEWRKINQGNTPNIVNTLPTSDYSDRWTGTGLYDTRDLRVLAPTTASPTLRASLFRILAQQPRLTACRTSYFEPCLDPSVARQGRMPGRASHAVRFDARAAVPGQHDSAPVVRSERCSVPQLGHPPKPNKSNGQAVSSRRRRRSMFATTFFASITRSTTSGRSWATTCTTLSRRLMAQPELGWDWYSYNTVTSTLSNPSNSAALKLSGTINPNLLVEASINYDGNIINITNSPNSFLPSGWSVNTFLQSRTASTRASSLAQKSMPSMNGFGNPYGTAEQMGNAPWHNAAEDYEPKLDVSYTSGKHAMKYGFSYNRYTKNQQVNGDYAGPVRIWRHFQGSVHRQPGRVRHRQHCRLAYRVMA